MKSSDLGPVLLRCRKGLRTHPAESPVAPAHTLRTCCPNTQEPASNATLPHEPSHQTVCAVCAVRPVLFPAPLRWQLQAQSSADSCHSARKSIPSLSVHLSRRHSSTPGEYPVQEEGAQRFPDFCILRQALPAQINAAKEAAVSCQIQHT